VLSARSRPHAARRYSDPSDTHFARPGASVRVDLSALAILAVLICVQRGFRLNGWRRIGIVLSDVWTIDAPRLRLECSYGGDNDQVGRCCFCFGRRNFRPGLVARAASSTGRHDHASPPSPPTPTVLLARSGTNVGLSTMWGKWHLHVGDTSPRPPPGPPQVLRLRYRTEPGGHNKSQGSNKVCPV